MKWFATVGLVMCTALAARGSAEAATNTARNRCSDAVRILRSSPTRIDVSVAMDPLTVDGAVRHWNQVIDSWNRASQQINQIPKADLDESDPDLAECFATVRSWAEYVKALDARIKEAQQAAKTVVPFLASVKPQRDALWPLLLAHYADGDVLVNKKASDAHAIMDGLAKVEAACTASLPDAGAAMPALTTYTGSVYHVGRVEVPSNFEQRADVWCYVAKHRDELMAKALEHKTYSAPGYGAYGILFPEALEHFAKGNTGLMVWVAIVMAKPEPFMTALVGEAKAWYAAAGLPMPATPFADVRAQLAAMREAGAKAAAEVAFEAKFHDSSLEAKGRAAVKKAEPSSKILASAVDAAGYSMGRDSSDMPERYRSGRVLIQRPSATWCEERTFTYVEMYQGGGNFQRGTAELTEATRLVRCP